jgi:acyl-CoA synthetase (NDP forming)/RimJ/RimL family protein N-acetyltransferase
MEPAGSDPTGGAAAGTLPPGYPTAWDLDVPLSDGSTVHVRPIRPDDGERLLDFHGRQSPESIYYRYFSPRPHLTDRDVEHLTTLDYRDRMAFVALRGDELVGVARYDRWEHRSEAEVAFFIDDRHHGRGMATVLLEHLAARAREVGITSFTASVLPDNRKMIGVFTSVGFESATRFADGVVEVRLDLQPTPQAERSIEDRARTAAARAVRRLLEPRSVAVIGAGRRPGTIGHDTFANLLRHGFEGPVWPVNPEAVHVASVRTVGSVLDIADDVDMAVIALPAPQVAAALEECGRKGIAVAVVLSAGFAETGPEGEAAEAEVVRMARRWGIRLLGPSCLGVLNTDPEVRLHATFARPHPLPGQVGLLSESGMVGAAIVDRARELGIGISSFVALGNRADVSGNDLLQYWVDDPRTSVVCMYIESFGNPRRFSRLARRLSRAKPVVAVKAGRPSPDRLGHVDDSEEALLRQNGVIRVPTLSALLDTARLLAQQPLPAGSEVAVIGNAGGSLTIAADACADAGLRLARLSPETTAGLAEIVGHPVDPASPVDLGIHASGADVERALGAVLADPGVHSALVLFAPSLGASTEEAELAIGAAASTKTVVGCFYGPHRAQVARDGDRSVPIYGGVDAAARALAHACTYARWLEDEEGDVVQLPDGVADAARAVVGRHLPVGGALDVASTAELLDAVGITMSRSVVVHDVDAAVAAATSLGYPVVLKSVARDDLAKTVSAGLALDLSDEGDVRVAWGRMAERLGARVAPAVVQPMEDPGIDVAVAVWSHPMVGPVLTLAAGGVAGALGSTADVRVLPLTSERAHDLVERSAVGHLLDGPSRTQAVRLLERVAALVESLPEVVEVDLDPVLVNPGRAVVTDARVVVAEVERDPVPPVRRVEG